VIRSEGYDYLKDNCPALQSEILRTLAGCEEPCSSGGKSQSVWAQLSDGGDRVGPISDGGDTSGRRVRPRVWASDEASPAAHPPWTLTCVIEAVVYMWTGHRAAIWFVTTLGIIWLASACCVLVWLCFLHNRSLVQFKFLSIAQATNNGVQYKRWVTSGDTDNADVQ
jgi:hypothetical protein